MKNYRHKLTGRVALIDESIGNHPVLGKHLEEVLSGDFEDDNKIVHEVEEDYFEDESEDYDLSETESTEEQ